MSNSESTPPIFSKLGHKDRGHLTTVNQAISKEQQEKKDDMTSEQT
jgi:hypothetical protein